MKIKFLIFCLLICTSQFSNADVVNLGSGGSVTIGDTTVTCNVPDQIVVDCFCAAYSPFFNITLYAKGTKLSTGEEVWRRVLEQSFQTLDKCKSAIPSFAICR